MAGIGQVLFCVFMCRDEETLNLFPSFCKFSFRSLFCSFRLVISASACCSCSFNDSYESGRDSSIVSIGESQDPQNELAPGSSLPNLAF